MGKAEWGIIAVFLLIACPLSFLVIAVCATFFLSNVTKIPEKAFPAVAFVALGLGIVFVTTRLKSWVRGFYALKTIPRVLLYLFWSAIATAVFMGLPIGNLTLGMLAGFYVGRKEHHKGGGSGRFEREARKASLFTAAITGFVSLAIGILAVEERTSLRRLLAVVGLGQLAETPADRAVVVALAVPVLIVAQYWLTHRAAYWGFRLARDNA